MQNFYIENKSRFPELFSIWKFCSWFKIFIFRIDVRYWPKGITCFCSPSREQIRQLKYELNILNNEFAWILIIVEMLRHMLKEGIDHNVLKYRSKINIDLFAPFAFGVVSYGHKFVSWEFIRDFRSLHDTFALVPNPILD